MHLGLLMFLSAVLLFLSTAAAQEPSIDQLELPGKFSILGHRECAPFEGVLFDVNATASLLTLPNYYSEKCRISTQYRLDMQRAEYDLKIENLNIRLDVLQKEYDETIFQKDNEIQSLQTALKKNSSKNPWLWAIIGGVVGAGATVAIVETVRD